MRYSIFAIAMVGLLVQRASAQPAAKPPAPTPDDLSKAADAAADLAAVGAGSSEDLARAADATAAVAGLPPAAAGTGKPSADDIDLSSMGLESGASPFDDKLNIFGFADIGYTFFHYVRPPPGVKNDTRTFSVGNLNVYLAKNLTAKARALTEVRLTFLPNGSMNADGSYTSTSAQDLANFSRPATWGGIVIERVYVEYDVFDHLTVRAGHWLTPYGIWNIDHGSPVILATNRPYIIGEQFFPEHQTGLDVFGSHDLADVKLSAHLTASNGRASTEAVSDPDSKLAFGARVEAETPWGLKLGGSYYRGRSTGLPASVVAVAPTYREASYGGDAQFKQGAVQIQGEVIVRDREYSAGQLAPGSPSFVQNTRDFGYYVLAAYHLDRWWNMTPFAYAERYEPADVSFFKGLSDVQVGLNFRPAANLIFKVQGNRAKLDDGPEFFAGQKVYYYSAQASWVF
jgi:hypothetical protein